MSKLKKILITIAVIIILCVVILQTCVYQRADITTDMSMDKPNFSSGNSPIVLFDAGHGNFHSIQTTFEPFATLLENDGVTIKEHKGLIDKIALENVDLFIIANATTPNEEADSVKSAFNNNEINILNDWVRKGGSVLLIADHDPFGSAASELAKSFGVGMASVWTVDTLRTNPELGSNTWLEYSMENGGLGEHSILQANFPENEIKRVVTFTGQSLSFDSTWTSILKLSSSAQNYYNSSDAKILSVDPSTYFRVPGQSQMIARKYGDGRIIIAGEAAMFTAQEARIFFKIMRVGFNYKGYDNKNFVLNIIHWLLSEFD